MVQRRVTKASAGMDVGEAVDVEAAEEWDGSTAYDRPDFNPTGPPHPDDPTLLRFTEFEGYLKAFRSDPVSGELILTLAIRPDQKYAAFKLTDFMLFRYRFDVYKAPKKIRVRKAATNGE